MSETALQEFTPERWEIIRSILSGEDGERVSETAAAREAGIPLRVLRAWIRRSEENRPEDDPLILEIAPFMESINRLQGEALEDEMWRRAMTGVDHPVVFQGEITDTYKKLDNKMLMQLMQVRDERYRPRTTHVNVNLNEPTEIYQRLLAGHRNAAAERERVIDLDKSQYEVVDEPALPAEFVKVPAPTEADVDL